VKIAATFAIVIAAGASSQSIWRAVTGFYGTRRVVFTQVCHARFLRDRFALVRVRVNGRRHLVALHLFTARTGWVVMWADGAVNRKIDPQTRPFVLDEVTRLKAKCLAP
jgi:hypothetical protein